MKKYAVNEAFLTVQGEGSRAGHLSVFLRFAGCNMWDGHPEHRAKGKGACARWCDTDFRNGTPMTAAEILVRCAELWPPGREGDKWVVITGGEPGLQFDQTLLLLFRDYGWKVAVESNGTVNNEAFHGVDLLTVSPKRGGDVVLLPNGEWGCYLELKVVLPGDKEQPWTEEELVGFVNQLDPDFCYVQPQDPIIGDRVQESLLHTSLPSAVPPELKQQFKANVERCFEVVRALPGFSISVQGHKLLGLA